MDLDAGTVLLQRATGGLFFSGSPPATALVGIGYGWLLRGTYALMAVGAVWVGAAPIRSCPGPSPPRASPWPPSWPSRSPYVRRKAGVARQRELVQGPHRPGGGDDRHRAT